MRGQLLVIDGPDQGRTFFLEEGQTLVIGRGPNTDMKLKDPRVSRLHCRVRLAGGRLHLTDPGSRAGTYVGDRRVVQQEFLPGESFRIGGTVIRFELERRLEDTTMCGSEGSAAYIPEPPRTAARPPPPPGRPVEARRPPARLLDAPPAKRPPNRPPSAAPASKTVHLPPADDSEDALARDLEEVRTGDASAAFSRSGPAQPAEPPADADDSALNLVGPAEGHEAPAAEPAAAASGADSAAPSRWSLVEFIRGFFRKAPPKPGPTRRDQQSPSEVVRCHSDVSFPAQAALARAEFLRVRLVRAEERTATGEVREVPKPHLHDITLALETAALVTVSAAAEGFEIEGRRQAELVFPTEGIAPETLFVLRGTRLGPGRVMVDFFQNGRPVGAVNLFPVVVADRPREAGRTPAGSEGGELRLAAAPPPAPDLVIQVFENRSAGGPGRLQFVLFSTRPDLRDLPVCFGDAGTLDLKSDVAAWVEIHLRRLGAITERPDATGDEVAQALADIGSQFFEQLLPPELQRLYWTLRQRAVRTVLVLSDEPHIPWELIKPYRKDPATGKMETEDVFWGEAFALSRWLRGRPPVASFSLDRVFALAASGTAPGAPSRAQSNRDMCLVAVDRPPPAAPASPYQALPYAAEELSLLHSLKAAGAGVEVLPPRRRDLQAALERGGFTLLHLACHGAFGGVSCADGSAVQMEDGGFSAAELSPRMEQSIRRGAPLIFFNACHSGRGGFSLTRLGSWGARLVELGCGAFVGALWPVTDQAALTFARAFYEMLTQGSAIAEAMAGARLRVRTQHPNDPTWLAYCCFADPLARMNTKRRLTARSPA